MPGPLHGIRVLDFGRYVAGPYCACLLGDLGAEIIRIERVTGGEDRVMGALAEDGSGPMFLQVNRNKRGLALDISVPEGRAIVRRLVATADVVVANAPEQALRSLGLDYESLRALKPDIVLTSVSAFGSGGPYSERVGFDGIAQVMSGVAFLTGRAGDPMKFWGAWADFCTASLAAFATVAALFHRQITGEGQAVEGSLLRTALTVGSTSIVEQSVSKPDREPSGNRNQTAGPSDLFRTKDGWILCQVGGPSQFRRWTELMGESGWLKDERFKDDLARGANGAVLSERMARWCAERTNTEALEALAQVRLPAGPLYTPQEVLDDPHNRAIGALRQVDYPGLPRPATLIDTPVSLSETPAGIRHRAPTLGEHTYEILSEAGYTAEDLQRLKESGVIWWSS